MIDEQASHNLASLLSLSSLSTNERACKASCGCRSLEFNPMILEKSPAIHGESWPMVNTVWCLSTGRSIVFGGFVDIFSSADEIWGRSQTLTVSDDIFDRLVKNE